MLPRLHALAPWRGAAPAAQPTCVPLTSVTKRLCSWTAFSSLAGPNMFLKGPSVQFFSVVSVGGSRTGCGPRVAPVGAYLKQ